MNPYNYSDWQNKSQTPERNCSKQHKQKTAPHDMFQVLRFPPLERIQQSGSTTKNPLPKIRSKVLTLLRNTCHRKNLIFLGIFTFQTEKNETPHHGWVRKELEWRVTRITFQRTWDLKAKIYPSGHKVKRGEKEKEAETFIVSLLINEQWKPIEGDDNKSKWPRIKVIEWFLREDKVI